MTGTAGGPTSDWEVLLDFPDDGWIWAPREDEAPARWAEEVCHDLGVTGAAAVELGAQLRAFATAFRERDPLAGALWLPDPQYGVLASRFVDVVTGEPGEELSLDRLEEWERTVDHPDLRPPEASRVQLPAGPALRVRRLDADQTGGPVSELVSHTLVPADLRDAQGSPVAVRHVVGWALLAEGDALAALADDCARLLRLERR